MYHVLPLENRPIQRRRSTHGAEKWSVEISGDSRGKALPYRDRPDAAALGPKEPENPWI